MKEFRKEVMRMQDRRKYLIDDHGAPVARDIKDNFQKLEDELQVGKGVHTIRDRLKRIRKLIEKADGPVISHGDADMLENWIDNALRKYR